MALKIDILSIESSKRCVHCLPNIPELPAARRHIIPEFAMRFTTKLQGSLLQPDGPPIDAVIMLAKNRIYF